MSAAEIIQEIRKLPLSEQKRVLDFLQSTNAGETPDVQYARDEDFNAAAEKVLNEHAELFRRLAQ